MRINSVRIVGDRISPYKGALVSSADYRGYKVVFIIIYKPYGIQYKGITTKELRGKGFWLVV